MDVAVPSQNGRLKRAGIRLHRCAALAGGGNLVTMRDRIPVTSVSRTVSDLRDAVAPKLVRRAIRPAELAGFRLDAVRSDRTRSDLERDFLRLCHRYGLPRPEVNVMVGRWRVDFLWAAQRLAVETDFWGYHRGSVAFEDDHARDLDLRARGYRTRRFTDRQIDQQPDRVAADVGAALGPP
jgi:very-short-patch-repair endonuclease